MNPNKKRLNGLIKVYAEELCVGKFQFPRSAGIVVGLLEQEKYHDIAFETDYNFDIPEVAKCGWVAQANWSRSHFKCGSDFLCNNARFGKQGNPISESGVPRCKECEGKVIALMNDIVQGFNSNFEFLIDFLPD